MHALGDLNHLFLIELHSIALIRSFSFFVKGVVTNTGYKYPNNLTFSWFVKVAQSCNINILLPRVTLTDVVSILES